MAALTGTPAIAQEAPPWSALLSGPRADEPATAAPNLTAEQGARLSHHISACWQRAPGAEQVAVTVEIRLSPDRRPTSVELLRSDAASPAQQASAFEAARRAVLRCAASGEGLPLPLSAYDHWKVIHLTFAPEEVVTQ